MRIKRYESSLGEVVGEWRAEISEDDHINKRINNDPISLTGIPKSKLNFFYRYSRIDV